MGLQVSLRILRVKLVIRMSDDVKTFISDIGNLLMDTKTSDIVLVCQGEEIKAHRFILCARSPVFSAMLQNNMLESVNREVKIDDVDKDVLKEMLRYMYKVEIGDGFTKFQELLVLADKYDVGQLVKYCSTKITESLNKDNVFQIGRFAENHNAKDLVHHCVKYVLDNTSDCLNRDWEDQVKESPMMMVELIKSLTLGRTNGVEEIIKLEDVATSIEVQIGEL